MTKVMAQGTFDILHPGHLHYLRESKKLGDELHVVIGRDSRVNERKELFMQEDARRQVVESLKVVDQAMLGSEASIYDTVKRIDPDVITLGHDQQFNVAELESTLADHGFHDTNAVQIREYRPKSPEIIVSSSEIKEKLEKIKTGWAKSDKRSNQGDRTDG